MIVSIFTIPLSLFLLTTIFDTISRGDFFHTATIISYFSGSILCVIGALKYEGIRRGYVILSGAILVLLAQPYFPNFLFYIPLFFASALVFIFERKDKLPFAVTHRTAEEINRNFALIGKNYCEKCGAEMPREDKICRKCGHEKIS